MTRERAWAIVFLAFLVGLALRLGAALVDPIPPVKDAAEYHGLASRLAHRAGYVREDGSPTAFRPPGLPLTLAVVYAGAGVEPWAGRIALSVVSACLVPLVGFLGARAFGWQAGAIASSLTALYPGFVTSWYGPRSLLAEPLLTTLVFAALALGVASTDGSPPRRADDAGALVPPPNPAAGVPAATGGRLLLLGASGLVAGLAALTRGTVLFLPPLLAVHVFLRTSGSVRERARLALVPLALALLVLAPWALRNRLVLGETVLVSTNGGISLWASYNPASRGLGNAGEGYTAALAEDEELRRQGVSEPERSRHFAGRAWGEIRARPARAVRLVLRKALLWADPTYEDWTRPEPGLVYNWGYGAVLPLALAGLFVRPRAPASGAVVALLVAFALTLSVLHVLVHTDVRYRITAEPVAIVLAAGALAALWSRLGTRRLVAASLVYAGLELVLAARFDVVRALLSRVTRGMGLG